MGYRRDSDSSCPWLYKPGPFLALLVIALLFPFRTRLSVFHPNFKTMKEWHGGRVGGCSHGCTPTEWCSQRVEWHGPWGNVITLDSYHSSYMQAVWFEMEGASFKLTRFEWLPRNGGSVTRTHTKIWRAPDVPPIVTSSDKDEVWRIDHTCAVPSPR
jgi:hypothetical protein